MKYTLTKLAAASVLTLSATAAFADSITQPGETAGAAVGVPLPPGLYFSDTTDWGVRDASSGGTKTAVGVTIPILTWSTPWQILGGRLIVAAATPAVEVGVTPFNHVGTLYAEGMYNPAASARLAWNLGGGFNFAYGIGGYARVNTAIAHDTNTFFQLAALSYVANGWNLSATAIYGINDRPIGTNSSLLAVNPDYFNLDLTATKAFGKWEIGAVGFYNTDVTDPVPIIGRQSQFALGALLGYDWGPLKTQAYLTRDVWQQNYGGFDTRIWTRIIVPLGDPFGGPAPMFRK
jgi:hypothetical protein